MSIFREKDANGIEREYRVVNGLGELRTELTGIIIHNGKRYREVKKTLKQTVHGQKVLCENKEICSVYDVQKLHIKVISKNGQRMNLDHSRYTVLEPVEN